MTDNEIINCAEECIGEMPCLNCPFEDESPVTSECMSALITKLIDIIDRQQAEIEKLKQVKSQLEKDIFNERMNYEAVKEELDEIEKEHKYLKKELDKYDPFYFCSFGGCEGVSNTCWKDCADSMYNVTRSEAIKEFAERLKAKCHNYYPSIDSYCVSVKAIGFKDIDDLVKEMVGDNNEI